MDKRSLMALPESGTCRKEVPGLNERDFSHDGPEPGSDIKWCAFCHFHSEKSKGGYSPSVTTPGGSSLNAPQTTNGIKSAPVSPRMWSQGGERSLARAPETGNFHVLLQTHDRKVVSFHIDLTRNQPSCLNVKGHSQHSDRPFYRRPRPPLHTRMTQGLLLLNRSPILG